MRILILALNFAPAWAFGGPPKKSFEIARELVRRGHEVVVITTNVLDSRNKIEKKRDVIDGVKVFYLNTLSNWISWKTKVFLPIGARELIKENVKNSDILMFVGFVTIFNIIGCHYSRRFSKPYVLLPYGALPKGSGLKKIVKCVIDLIFGYEILKTASAVFAQNDHEVQESRKCFVKEKQIKLVPLNIDLVEFQSLPPKGIFRRKLGINDNEKVILFLGRLHKYKGLDLLLKSFSRLSQTRNNYRLVIVGKDDGFQCTMLALIKSLRLEGKAFFAGALYGQDRLKAYVDADVFVMPSSHFEETSVAALEACASSVPVIVTKQASIPGLDEYQAGITINCDQKELEDALLRILDNVKLGTKMGENGQRMIRDIFDLRIIIDQFEESFYAITENRE